MRGDSRRTAPRTLIRGRHVAPGSRIAGPGLRPSRLLAMTMNCHCEEHCDEAIPGVPATDVSWFSLFHFSHGGFWIQSAATPRERVDPVLLPVAAGRALRESFPDLGPVAERIAVPRRFGSQCRKSKLLPDRFCLLHVFAGGER